MTDASSTASFLDRLTEPFMCLDFYVAVICVAVTTLVAGDWHGMEMSIYGVFIGWIWAKP